MAEFRIKTKNEANIKDKPRVYFTCHPLDFDAHFDRICADILAAQDCAIFYTEDMAEPLSEENITLDLHRMNLVVVPVTFRLLSTDNRAMTVDIPYAMEHGIPVLPLMMESGIVEIYSRPDKFGERQFITPDSHEASEIAYEKKLRDYLGSVLTSDEVAQRVRAAFDAYIFLSYRKKDRVLANELMKLIHENPKYRDIAIWYDEFLSPGESFRDNITRALKDSKIFALLVTPSLLETPNFVMDEEYPAARESGKPILPVEMTETDKDELSQKYEQIPEAVPAEDNEALYSSLADMLVGIAIAENDNDPEHNYLIGLAYLHGIDVEVDRERGMELITAAAEADYLDAMDRLYEIYQVKGNFRQCLYWSKRLYDYNLKVHGPDYTETVINLINIAYSYAELEDYQSAIKYNELACGASERVFGETHNFTLIAKGNLAVSYLSVEMFDKALNILEEVCRIRCEINGEEDKDTIIALGNLAGLYCDLEDDRGLPLLERVYELSRRTLGEEHHETLLSLYNLADYLAANNIDGAYEMQKKAYHTMCKVLGEEHPDTLKAMLSLALTESDLGKSEEAIRLFERGRELSLSILGENNHTTRSFICYLAMEYKTVGNGELCIRYLTELYDICLRTLGPDHEDTRMAELDLNIARIDFR